ncbi:MAG: hypothetical protein V9G14_16975 [Cypionkella sp.]
MGQGRSARGSSSLLERSHGRELPGSRTFCAILRGKALEFDSRHYGQVLYRRRAGAGRTATRFSLGINLLLDDLLAGKDENGKRRPPDAAEPALLFLRVFQSRRSMARGELDTRRCAARAFPRGTLRREVGFGWSEPR